MRTPLSLGFSFSHISVDDGTGLITCNVWKNEQGLYCNTPDLELGHFVNVQGKLHSFRNEKRINVLHIRILPNPAVDISFPLTRSLGVEEDVDAESLRWLEIVHLWKNYYGNKPQDAT